MTAPEPALAGTPSDEPEVRHKRDLSSFQMINLAPMCAVAFQLLIFCMATTNFVREGVIASKLPELNPAAKPIPQMPVQINITESLEAVRQVSVDNSPQPLEGLIGYMAALLKSQNRSAETPVNIQPASGVRWDTALRVYNSCVAAGFTKINWQLSEGERPPAPRPE